MKLCRQKDRGPKVKSEDVHIPEEYLAYESEAEAKKYRERNLRERYNEEQEKKSAQVVQDEGSSIEARGFERRINDLNAGASTRMQRARAATPEKTASEAPRQGAKRPQKRKLAKEAAPQAKPERKKTAKKQPEAPKESNVPAAFVVFLVFLVFFTAGFVLMLGPIMNIDHVEISSLKYVDEAEVERLAGAPIGKNLLLYKTAQAEEAIKTNPYVENVEIKRHLPHYIEIVVQEREPAGVLLSGGKYLSFSKEGILLDKDATLSKDGFPIITGFTMDEVPELGGTFKNSERFTMALDIVNACSDELLTMIQELNIKDTNNILAYTSQGLEIRIGDTKNIEKRMKILEDIINQVVLSDLIEDEIGAIDVRSEKSPVVVKKGYESLTDEELAQYIEANTEKNATEAASSTQAANNSAQTNTTTQENSADASTENQTDTDAENATATDTTDSTTPADGTTTQQ